MEVMVLVKKSKMEDWELSAEELQEGILKSLRCIDLPDLSTLYVHELYVQVEVTE